MPEFEATSPNQVQEFLVAGGGVAVIDCYATWCGPCKAIAPVLHELCDKTGITLIKVDVDKAEEVSKTYKIEAMPTLLVVKDNWNNVVERVVGGGKANAEKVFNAASTLKQSKWFVKTSILTISLYHLFISIPEPFFMRCQETSQKILLYWKEIYSRIFFHCCFFYSNQLPFFHWL